MTLSDFLLLLAGDSNLGFPRDILVAFFPSDRLLRVFVAQDDFARVALE